MYVDVCLRFGSLILWHRRFYISRLSRTNRFLTLEFRLNIVHINLVETFNIKSYMYIDVVVYSFLVLCVHENFDKDFTKRHNTDKRNFRWYVTFGIHDVLLICYCNVYWNYISKIYFLLYWCRYLWRPFYLIKKTFTVVIMWNDYLTLL